MSDITMKMAVGHVNSGLHKWKQITAGDTLEEPVYAFIPVNGDVTFTTIEAMNVDVSSANSVNTYYEGLVYTGNYTKLVLATGTALAYLGLNK